jgi:4-hydroxymandelate oxidase
MRGVSDRPPVNLDEYEALARERLPRMTYDFFAGGAGDEWTLRENRLAYDRWVVRPRILQDVSRVDCTATVLGQSMPAPILVAPTAMQRLAHEDGELAMGRGAAAAGTTMVVSTVASVSLEDVASTGVPRWFQLYLQRDRAATEDLVRRAAAAGYTALVLTVDAPTLGRRERDERNEFKVPPEIRLANLGHAPLPDVDTGSSQQQHFADMHAVETWDDVAWLQTLSDLPLLLKGVVTAEGAVRAVEAGAAGIIVSNHGGRQLDGAPATLDALPEVVTAAGDRLEVLVDGGIRRGVHVLKALALGARAVLVGRPPLWGLAVDGANGVQQVVEMLRAELVRAMTLSGTASLAAVDRSLVTRAGGPPEV